MASPTLGSSRTGTPLNPYTDPSLEESETDRAISQTALLQTAQRRSQAQDANEALISQREREIENIAQGVIDLANIFQELQTMVIDQGSMLDRIDYNVERMATEVKEADKELKVATNYQRRSVKRKAMLLLAICIAAVIILLGLKLGSRGSPAPAPAPEPPQNNKPNGGGKGNGKNGKPPRGLLGEPSVLRRRSEWRRRRRRLWEAENELVVYV
jgi:syntaxin 16